MTSYRFHLIHNIITWMLYNPSIKSTVQAFSCMSATLMPWCLFRNLNHVPKYFRAFWFKFNIVQLLNRIFILHFANFIICFQTWRWKFLTTLTGFSNLYYISIFYTTSNLASDFNLTVKCWKFLIYKIITYYINPFDFRTTAFDWE